MTHTVHFGWRVEEPCTDTCPLDSDHDWDAHGSPHAYGDPDNPEGTNP